MGEVADRLADVSSASVKRQVSELLATRLNVLRHVRDAMADNQDRQKEHTDAKGRSCIERYEVRDQVLLNAKTFLRMQCLMRSRFIVPFTVVSKKGLAYTLNLPCKLRTHPVFYVGMLKTYWDPNRVDVEALVPRESTLSQAMTSESGYQADPSSKDASVPAFASASAPLSARCGSEKTYHGDVSSREPTQREIARYTGLRRRCSISRVTFSFIWRSFSRSVVATTNISIWRSDAGIMSHITRRSLRYIFDRTSHMP